MEKYPNTKPFPIEHKIEPNNFASAVPGKYTNLKLPIVVDQRNIRNGNICDQCTYEIILCGPHVNELERLFFGI